MKTISPEKFWDAFATKLPVQNRKKDIPNENYQDDIYKYDSLWTPFIIEFLVALGQKEFNIQSVEKEYFRKIDVAWFDRCCELEEEWAWEVAIEHENNSKTWDEEFRKLLHINCGLKVLISYYKDKNFFNSFMEKRQKKIIQIYKSRKYHQNNDNWLFIFGPVTQLYCRENKKYDYLAFKFNGLEMKPLRERVVLWKK